MKYKIFVSAYACEPNLGSEIGVGWNWVLQMSNYFDLWVLTRKSNKSNIENWLSINPSFNKINFLYYDMPKKLMFWKKGLRGVRIYYFLWQKLTNQIVKKTMKENNINMYHLLTYGNAIWPVSNYGKKQLFIWGPTSVGDIIPSEFSRHYNLKGRIIEFIRRLSVSTLKINLSYLNRCKHADLIFCKTKTTYDNIPAKYQSKAIIFTDVAVEDLDLNYLKKEKHIISQNTKYLAVGRLDCWRGFDLLIEAFSKSYKKNNKISLEILGDGTDKKRLLSLIKTLKLNHCVKLLGYVSRDIYYKKLFTTDIVINPALKEAAVTTSFDALSIGKPLVCIETGGYTRHFNNNYAVVIPQISRSQVILDLSRAIIQLSDKEIRQKKSVIAKKMSANFTWKEKGLQISRIINNHFSQIK